jgi:hypothetical protein
MLHFQVRSSIVPNMNEALDFLKASYAVIYNANSKEAGQALRLAMSAFGTDTLRWVHNKILDFGCFDDVKPMKEQGEIKYFCRNSKDLLQEIERVRTTVSAAVNDKWLMTTNDEYRKAGMIQLKKAAEELKWFIEQVEEPKHW